MPKRYQQGCVDVITLDERLASDSAEDTRRAFEAVLGGGLPHIVVDLHEVRFVDSLGLQYVCDFHAECRRRGGDLRLAAPGRLLRDVLRVTGLDEQIEVYDNVLGAVGEFAQ